MSVKEMPVCICPVMYFLNHTWNVYIWYWCWFALFIVLFVMQIDLVRSPLYSMLSDYKSRPNFCSFFNQYHLVVSIDSWSSADPMP